MAAPGAENAADERFQAGFFRFFCDLSGAFYYLLPAWGLGEGRDPLFCNATKYSALSNPFSHQSKWLGRRQGHDTARYTARPYSKYNRRAHALHREANLAITLTALNVYPVKSCRGISLTEATLAATGLEHDREWMIVTPSGRFVTQREEPRLASIETYLDEEGLQIILPDAGELFVPFNAHGGTLTAVVWNDRCGAFDMGSQAADLLTAFLGKPHRLVRFNPAGQRLSNPVWTGITPAFNLFSDGYPLLAISEASLTDLNSRLEMPLPMNRFRPNLVFDGFSPYGEDTVHELANGTVRLRAVKPCTRCKITTTDQKTGLVTGTEPLNTLRTYRLNRELKGVLFGQNVIPVGGLGQTLAIGQTFEPFWR